LRNDGSSTQGVRSQSKSQARDAFTQLQALGISENGQPISEGIRITSFSRNEQPKKDPRHHRPRAGKISFASATRLSRRLSEANLPKITFSSRLKVRNRLLVSSRTRGFPRLHLLSRRAPHRLQRAGVPRLLVVWLYRQYSLQPEHFPSKNTFCNNCAKRFLFSQAIKINRDLAVTYFKEVERSDFLGNFRIKIISEEEYYGNNVPASHACVPECCPSKLWRRRHRV
jgi:hypothetical protein